MSNNINASICSTKPGIDDNCVFHRANVLKNAANQGFISHVTRKDMNALKQCLVPIDNDLRLIIIQLCEYWIKMIHRKNEAAVQSFWENLFHCLGLGLEPSCQAEISKTMPKTRFAILFFVSDLLHALI